MNNSYFEDCWNSCTLALQEEVGDFSFKTWFQNLKFISFDNNSKILILESSDTFYIEHITNKYMDKLLDICRGNFNQGNLNIKFILENDTPEVPQAQDNSFNKNIVIPNNLNSNYIFENFIIGESNRLAHAASVAVAESPGIYNPLFLYGDVGLGKTHLMHAIANYILIKDPNTKVLYASCEKFTNELITSIREQKNGEFREKYRKIDVLLIDDIQFIVDKTQTQEEFFHTFNDLKDAGKQIIISSDRPPNEIETLTERLRSRFAGGLLADIKLPNFETRTAILQKKAESLNVNISKDVSQFIAKSIKSNIRELEGALTRVIAYSNLTGMRMSVSLAEEALSDLVQEEDLTLGIDSVINIVANEMGVSITEIKSKKRTRKITEARQVYMYIARDILNESLITIGKTIGRDHSTVLHGIKKIEQKLNTDAEFYDIVFNLREKVYRM